MPHFEVLKFRLRFHRDRIRFDDGPVELLAIEAAARTDLLEERRLALVGCLTRLSERKSPTNGFAYRASSDEDAGG